LTGLDLVAGLHGGRRSPAAVSPDEEAELGRDRQVSNREGGAHERIAGATVPQQALQGTGKRIAQALALKELPLVERRAVGEGEPGQKAIPVQVHGLGQQRSTLCTEVVRCVLVAPARSQALAQDIDVDPCRVGGIRVPLHGLTVDGQPAVTQGAVEQRQGAAPTSLPAWPGRQGAW